jgi:hypothetical protein
MVRRRCVVETTVSFHVEFAVSQRDPIIKPTSLLLAALFSVAIMDTAAAAHGGGGRSQTAPSVTVPLQFDGDFPVIVVRINGHKVRVTIDLAQIAPVSLQQSTAIEVKAVAVDSNAVSDAPAGSAVPLIKVQRIEIGGMVFSNVDGYVDVRAPATLTPTTPQGVIGFTLLRSFKVILDYKHKFITFIQGSRLGTESDACTGMKVPFMPEWHGAPVAKAHTDLGDLILVWDTGAARGVIRKKSADDLHATVSNCEPHCLHRFPGDTALGSTLMQCTKNAIARKRCTRDPRSFDALMA